MKVHVWMALTAGLLLAVEKPSDDAVKKEQKQLDGTWDVVAVVLEGFEVPEERLHDFKFIHQGNQATVKAQKMVTVTQTLDPTKTPKTIDSMPTTGPNKGKTLLGIYELKGDTLKICYALPGKDRPKKFASQAQSGHILVVLKRQNAGKSR